MIRLIHNLRFVFCKFKYYKDLAAQIDYSVPKLNEELGFAQKDKCWVLGYKLKNSPQVQSQSTTQNNINGQKKVQNGSSKQELVQLQYDPLAKEELFFGDVQKFANQNDFDVCATDIETKQVTLVKMRQAIYRKFYQTKIYKAKSVSKKHKEIRVPENIQDHDILNKVANIRSMIKKGQFKFKIYAENDSSKSEKAVKRLCQFLGRKPNVSIEQFELQQKLKGQRRIVIQRWTTFLDFSQQSKIDYDKINRKWRRHLLNKKVEEQKSVKKRQNFSYQGLQNQPIDVQRQILKELRQEKISLPSHFREYEQMEDLLDHNDPSMLFQHITKQSKLKHSKKFTHKMKYNEKDQQQQMEQDSQEGEEQHTQKAGRSSTERQVEEDQNDVQALSNKLKMRTVEDILDEIDEMKSKSRRVELGAFELRKLKQLQKQLKGLINKGSRK